MTELKILYYIIFTIIIIFTIYYFWRDLNNKYNTGGNFAEGFKEGLNKKCGSKMFWAAEDKACESCAGLQPPCDDCICSDFGKETQDGCLAACKNTAVVKTPTPPTPPPFLPTTEKPNAAASIDEWKKENKKRCPRKHRVGTDGWPVRGSYKAFDSIEDAKKACLSTFSSRAGGDTCSGIYNMWCQNKRGFYACQGSEDDWKSSFRRSRYRGPSCIYRKPPHSPLSPRQQAQPQQQAPAQPIKSDQICFNPNTLQKSTKIMEKVKPYLNKSLCINGSLLSEAANVAKFDLITAFGAAVSDIQRAQPHLDKARPHLEAAFKKAGPHLNNAMKKAKPQITQSIFEKSVTQQPNTQHLNTACPNGCLNSKWNNSSHSYPTTDNKKSKRCIWTSQNKNTKCSQCSALLIPKNNNCENTVTDPNIIQNKLTKSQNSINLNKVSTLSSIQEKTSQDYVNIGKIYMVDLSIQKKITLPPITNQEYERLGQLLHKHELNKTHKQQITTMVNNILNTNIFPSSIDKNNTLLANLEEELNINDFYAPNLPSALKEAQSDNRLGGSKTSYKKNYKPIDPRKYPRPYDSVWDIFRN